MLEAFNAFAFLRPKNDQEFLQLLDEAIRMGYELHDMIDAMSDMLFIAAFQQRQR